jgi:hypothetical protein
MSESQALEVVKPAPIVSAADFMPVFTVAQAIDRKEQVNAFIAGVLKDGEDYGKMPGGRVEKVLLKPGAEKLCSIFGLTPRFVAELEVEDWTGADHGGEPLFYYKYKCQLFRGDRLMGESIGSANSWEAKHRYRWVAEEDVPQHYSLDDLQTRGGKKTLFEFEFALDKRETSGAYGKPEKYWNDFEAAIDSGRARRVHKATKKGERPGYEYDTDLTVYRIPNPDTADVVNTCQKMAQKRALVAVVLIVTNCSDAFTQDLEDAAPAAAAAMHQQNTPEEQAELAKRRIQETRDDGPTVAAGESSSRNDTGFPSQPAAEIPGPLRALFENLAKPGYLGQAFSLLKNRLTELSPDGAEATYKRVLADHGIEPGAKTDVPTAKAALLEMWQIADEWALAAAKVGDDAVPQQASLIPEVVK